jgi:hypothetical protein
MTNPLETAIAKMEAVPDFTTKHEFRQTLEAIFFAQPDVMDGLKYAQAEIERLREALLQISSPTQTRDLLWWQEAARTALEQKEY